MTITVFGATGQVGSRIVSMALAKGWHVKAFGRNVESLIDEDMRNKNFEAIKGYVFDADDVLNAVQGCDAVFSALGGAWTAQIKPAASALKILLSRCRKQMCKGCSLLPAWVC